MTSRPDILWIVTTQWRAQATGYGGDPNALTPWLDGLASEAINYSEAVTPHPLGPQARAALLTGRLCPGNGVRGYWDPLPADARTIAHALAERGYATAFFGKWHLHERDRRSPLVGEAHARQLVPADRRGGFQLWEGFESGFLLNDPWLHGTRLPTPRQFKGYQADVLVQRAAEWLRERTRERAAGGAPGFCMISLESPHPPYHAPAPQVRAMDPAQIVLRPNVPTGGDPERRAREELAGYYAHVEATDRAIGKLLAEVDVGAMGLVFTSVHGDMHGSHGLFRKAWPFEESVRVPLLVRWPRGTKPAGRLPAGGRNTSPVSLIDLSQLAVAWADGRDWECRRDHVAISMPVAAGLPEQCPHAWRGIRSPDRKFVLKTEADGSEKPWLFFDLRDDPWEQRNLLGQPARQGELQELLRRL